jgi:hypothetical protein
MWMGGVSHWGERRYLGGWEAVALLAWAALLSQLEVLYYTETSHEIVVYGVAIVVQARWKVDAPPPIVS